MWSSSQSDDLLEIQSSTECETRLIAVLGSDDVDVVKDGFETAFCKTRLVRATTKHRVIMGLLVVASGCLCAISLGWKHYWGSGRNMNAGQLQSKFDSTMLIDNIIKGLWSNADPFQFRCPVPLALVVTSTSGDTQAQTGHLTSKSTCCGLYDASWWPYQYPECGQDGACPSCWKTSDADAERFRETLSVAGVAWAAANAVYEQDHNKDKDFIKKTQAKVFGSPMIASLTAGLRPHVANVCPKIGDWRQYTFEKHMDPRPHYSPLISISLGMNLTI
jgi:hypothetical protein